jgi:hypothetical protein
LKGFGPPFQESIMSPTHEFTAPATQFGRKVETSTPTAARKPALSESFSLIIVMLIYILFCVAGFFAAAQLPLGVAERFLL